MAFWNKRKHRLSWFELLRRHLQEVFWSHSHSRSGRCLASGSCLVPRWQMAAPKLSSDLPVSYPFPIENSSFTVTNIKAGKCGKACWEFLGVFRLGVSYSTLPRPPLCISAHTRMPFSPSCQLCLTVFWAGASLCCPERSQIQKPLFSLFVLWAVILSLSHLRTTRRASRAPDSQISPQTKWSPSVISLHIQG